VPLSSPQITHGLTDVHSETPSTNHLNQGTTIRSPLVSITNSYASLKPASRRFQAHKILTAHITEVPTTFVPVNGWKVPTISEKKWSYNMINNSKYWTDDGGNGRLTTDNEHVSLPGRFHCPRDSHLNQWTEIIGNLHKVYYLKYYYVIDCGLQRYHSQWK
jgi:hypothetical protein